MWRHLWNVLFWSNLIKVFFKFFWSKSLKQSDWSSSSRGAGSSKLSTVFSTQKCSLSNICIILLMSKDLWLRFPRCWFTDCYYKLLRCGLARHHYFSQLFPLFFSKPSCSTLSMSSTLFSRLGPLILICTRNLTYHLQWDLWVLFWLAWL